MIPIFPGIFSLFQETWFAPLAPIFLNLFQRDSFGFGHIEVSPYQGCQSYHGIKPESTGRIPQVLTFCINLRTAYRESMYDLEESKRNDAIEKPHGQGTDG